MIVADATLMLLVINPKATVPGKVAVSDVSERIAFLIDTLENSNEKILIPTPVLSEMLIRTRNGGADAIDKLNKYACFEMAPFDYLAAYELAELTKKEVGKKKLNETTTYAKLRFDRQIVSIAKVRRVRAIFSDDEGVETFAKIADIPVVKLSALPLPPPKQTKVDLTNQRTFSFLEDPLEGTE